jgi:hypothetical protein
VYLNGLFTIECIAKSKAWYIDPAFPPYTYRDL